jgi:DNA invertase Pin-like site-specific DNA recombinase
MFVRAYLRVSTNEQDATCARQQPQTFATERGLSIAAWYIENESGTKLARPELFWLLADPKPGDILLVEQVDRLSRLNAADWEKLRTELAARHVRIVALNLPTSWMMAAAVGRRKAKPRQKRRAATQGAKRTRPGRLASRPCSGLVRRGLKSRRQPDAAGPPSPRSPSASKQSVHRRECHTASVPPRSWTRRAHPNLTLAEARLAARRVKT